jgi:prevent-host-death family protein
MQIGELKSKFSEVIERVKQGEKIVVSYGKSKRNVAVIVPYDEYKATNAVRIGLLEGKASYEFAEDFDMTGEELVGK